MAAGAVEGFIRDEAQWLNWLHDHPGQCYASSERVELPFYVISRVVSEGPPAEYMHHRIGQQIAKELLQTPRDRFLDLHWLSGVRFGSLACHQDSRGHLVSLFRKDELRVDGLWLDTPPMAYLSVTKPGVLRGPHEHLTQTDIFIFCNSAFEVFLWDNRKTSASHWGRMRLVTHAGEYSRLIIPPGVVHAYRALDQEGTVINCPDKLYAGWKQSQPVDEIRHENDPGSPFQPWA